MDSSSVVRKALGRGASLCDLYDVRQDQFCGVSLLSSAPPEAAISSIDVPDIFSEYTNQSSYQDKFHKLNVEASLKISVLSDLVELSGSGKYLTDEAKTQKVVRGTLIYKITTKEESINLLHNQLRPHVITQLLNAEATHVVSKIRWGADVFVTFEKKVQNNKNAVEVEGLLQASLKTIAKQLVDISGKGEVQYSDTDLHEEESFSIRLQGDVVPDQPPPQSVEEAVKLINRIPHDIKSINQGKGKPVEVGLYPLKLLADHFGMTIKEVKLMNDIDSATIGKVEAEVDNSVFQMQILNDFVADVKEFREHVSDDELYECLTYVTSAKTAQTKFRSALKEAVLAIRQTGALTSVLDEAMQKYHQDPHSADKIPIFINKKSALKGKMEFFSVMKEKGVDFLSKDKSIDNFVAQHDKQMVYILCYTDALRVAEKEKWQNANLLFLELRERNEALVKATRDGDIPADSNLNQEETKFLLVDEAVRHRGTESSIRIEQYLNGRLLTNDFARDKDIFTQNFILAKRKIDKIGSSPPSATALRLICPLAIKSNCDRRRRLWVCYRCNERMQYGFDDHFYCYCGGVLLKDCQFKCCDPRHGSHFKSFENVEELKEHLPKVPPVSDKINILLLGQTGVGKTTWINALRNYLEYKTLREAMEGEVKVLVPSKFSQGDTEVLVGSADPSQEASTASDFAGQSSTQSCRSHVFSMDEMTIQIIDTPGIGDVRGIVQDRENTEHILQYINREDHLHGICILLKPNESRLTAEFQFCLTSLLNNLHKNAANNIMFCYTNTRGTLYSYGETNGLVKTMLREIKRKHGQEIPYSKGNTFFFDSESFRLLACKQQGMEFPETTIDAFSGSWDKAFDETLRLISTIQDSDPHVVAETVSLNEARKLITLLSRPLAEIANTIAGNIANIDLQSEKIKQTVNEKEQLEACLTRYVETLEIIPLDYPRTVCTSQSCISIVDNVVEFSTVCHDHCYVKNVPHDTIGHPALSYCSCMDKETEKCKTGNCRCSRLLHQHITYITRRVAVAKKDESVEKQIAEQRSIKEIVESKMAQIAKDIEELEEEKNKISSASAGFAVFLKENAITPFNDSIDQYLESMIKQRNMMGEIKEMKELEKLRMQYAAEKELYEMNLALSFSNSLLPSESRKKLRPEDVPTVLEELNKLPKSGPWLREQIKVSQSCMAKFETHHSTSTFTAPRLASDQNWFLKKWADMEAAARRFFQPGGSRPAGGPKHSRR